MAIRALFISVLYCAISLLYWMLFFCVNQYSCAVYAIFSVTFSEKNIFLKANNKKQHIQHLSISISFCVHSRVPLDAPFFRSTNIA